MRQQYSELNDIEIPKSLEGRIRNALKKSDLEIEVTPSDTSFQNRKGLNGALQKP